jgi:putative SOS response-associated peptidase YedK
MCGRYTLKQPADALAQQFQVTLPTELPARYNVAPGQPIFAVRETLTRSGPHREPAVFQWGLVPSWAKDPSIGSRLLNARAETLAEKPSFRAALKYRRCLIPADGFYEWQSVGKLKVPFHIRLRDGAPFAFAGLWETWERPEGYLETCTIVTTTANEALQHLHERMPVILPPERYQEWLDPTRQKGEALLPLLKPYRADEIALYPVGDLVNRVANEGPALIEPRPTEPDPPADQLSLM